MRKLVKLNVVVAILSSLLGLVACSSFRSTPTPTVSINLALVSEAFSNRFAQLDYGVRLNKKHMKRAGSIGTGYGVIPERWL